VAKVTPTVLQIHFHLKQLPMIWCTFWFENYVACFCANLLDHLDTRMLSFNAYGRFNVYCYCLQIFFTLKLFQNQDCCSSHLIPCLSTWNSMCRRHGLYNTILHHGQLEIILGKDNYINFLILTLDMKRHKSIFFSIHVGG
jgi:hypothetical protein